jgi:probable rRNA maturation factor
VIALDIAVEADGWTSLSDAEELAQRAADAALAVSDAEEAEYEAAILLTDDAHIRELNASWRGKDKATNVLSFPSPQTHGHQGPRYLGDIALAYETLVREAEDESKPLAHHFAHLVVHGILHLLGYDHEVDEEADIMEALEIKALATLGIADPYSDMAA